MFQVYIKKIISQLLFNFLKLLWNEMCKIIVFLKNIDCSHKINKFFIQNIDL